MKDQPREILKTIFGYDSFRPLQEEVIHNILSGKDTLVIMPTGGGKSICYQIPALLFPGLTIVVSPLISLMKDQVEQLSELGITAVTLNSSLTPDQLSANISLIRQKKARLVYMAPETLLKEGTMELLSSERVDCLTIDEAHCISAWGHDFRPEYRRLISVRSRFPDMVCVALTATATPRVRQDIQESLNFDSSAEFIGSFNRENLNIRVVQKASPLAQTLAFIEDYRDHSGIIYCLSRKQVDELSGILLAKGYSVRPYHAGLPDMQRMKNQELFIRDDIRIMVATIAFGMGINKSNVRFIVHYDLPKNIESYYQEIGRAGRDGLPSQCLLLFSYSDIYRIKYLIQDHDEQKMRVAINHLDAMVRYAETDLCRRKVLLRYFGEEYEKENCSMCDNCLTDHKTPEDITIEAQKFLSCVKRTGEIFGIQHIIDVLRGSKSKKIERFHHQDLSTYGIGKDHTKRQWQHFAHQFLHKGFMTQDMEFGGIGITPEGWEVLKGKVTVTGNILPEKSPAFTAPKNTGMAEPEYDPELFDLLRSRRKQLATEADVPPYVIFSDKTLMEMATLFPQSKESLLSISGVGTMKLRKYGRDFLYLLQEYCRRNRLEDKAASSGRESTLSGKPTGRKRHQAIGELYNAGKAIPDIMAMFNIKQITVLDHLFTFFTEGHPLRNGSVIEGSALSAKEKKTVLKAFDKHGVEFLSPVYSSLNCSVSYEELKILRLYYLFQQQASAPC
ncbi:MAG: DNA helicase RecQ [Desulfobacteraceae bacterium]|nr:MAG: DNA helicase RecQ [Desulfobacteraceae bacterium]